MNGLVGWATDSTLWQKESFVKQIIKSFLWVLLGPAISVGLGFGASLYFVSLGSGGNTDRVPTAEEAFFDSAVFPALFAIPLVGTLCSMWMAAASLGRELERRRIARTENERASNQTSTQPSLQQSTHPHA